MSEEGGPVSVGAVSDIQGDGGDVQPAIKGLPPVVNVGYKYANAPIVEATLDLWVEGDPEVAIQDLATVLDQLEYQKPTELYEVSHQSDWSDTGERLSSRAVRGYRAMSTDESSGVEFTPERFSFSVIGHYEDWSTFVALVEGCWARYRKVAAPQRIKRASVRFVNLIRIPKDAFEVRDYLRTSFELSPYLPQMVTDFFSQVEFVLPDIFPEFSPKSVVTVALSPPQGGMLLDIAVKADADIDMRSESFSTDLTDMLTKLRHAKNFVFESCITDATRSLIS